MAQIFDQLKSLISPDMISKASTCLGERDANVSNAVSTIMPGVLASLMKKGDSAQVEATLQEAGRTNILSDLGRVFSGNMTQEQTSLGDRFLQLIMGNKANDFVSSVAQDSGISTTNASRLTTMVSTVVAGFLGNKVANNKNGLSGLLSELGREKSSILGMLPSKFTNNLGLSTWSTSNVDNRAYATGISNNSTNKNPKKSGWGWLTWVILIILLLLLFFWWRSCKRTNTVVDMDRTTTTYVDTVRNNVAATTTNTRTNDRDTVSLELPDGTKIRAYKRGAEEDILNYVKSDRYKNANADDLKKKWFGFDNIRFKFDSTTELMDGSHPQMDNVAAILKAYPDTKVVIGGFADVVGGEQVNEEVSKDRADYIKNLLVQKGISSSRIMTEGHGEEFAKHKASDSDTERAEDRTVALRFYK